MIPAVPNVIPDGIAIYRVLFRNPGRYLLWFGVSDKKNDGIPMVRLPITVRCLGRNGYLHIKIATSRAMNADSVVFERNSTETRSMFAIMRRPSATTPGSFENFPSIRTSFATARVA